MLKVRLANTDAQFKIVNDCGTENLKIVRIENL